MSCSWTAGGTGSRESFEDSEFACAKPPTPVIEAGVVAAPGQASYEVGADFVALVATWEQL